MSRLIRDDVDKFFDYGVDIQTRTIYMGSSGHDDEGEFGVNHQMSERVYKALHLLDEYDDTGKKPITIVMNNPGGDYYHGMAIYDAIKERKNHVTIKVYGMAMSMGSLILQAADERIMTPHAAFMVHYGENQLAGHSKNVIQWAKEEERILTVMEEIYLNKIKEKNPKFKRSQLKKLLEFDTILTAEETVKIGLADKILDE